AAFTEQENRIRQTFLQIDQNTIQVQQDMINMDYNLRQAKRDYERQDQLLKNNATSQQAYENAKYNYEFYQKRKELALESHKLDSLFRKEQLSQMQTSLVDMRRNLDFVKTKLENLVLRAPVTGQLTALYAELGESKSSGQDIGQIDVMDGFKLQCTPDEHYLPRIILGLRGNFDLSGKTYYCRVSKIFPQVIGFG
ncbi:efflux RND transporter periplasmic adaptor subunit, partial [candidate division KSB1 bacterium]